MKHVVVLVLCILGACAPAMRGPEVSPTSTLAVAGFICPHNDWELMAGVLPEEKTEVDAKTLHALDSLLADAVSKRGGKFLSSSAVRQCEEVVIAKKERRRRETVDYWTQVGECLGTEYLLVPYVTHWHERDGSEYGVNRPASVTMDLYLVTVASGDIRRYHFEEEQCGLAENLLSGKRFVKRKGRWITPEELASEGIAEGFKELGL